MIACWRKREGEEKEKRRRRRRERDGKGREGKEDVMPVGISREKAPYGCGKMKEGEDARDRAQIQLEE